MLFSCWYYDNLTETTSQLAKYKTKIGNVLDLFFPFLNTMKCIYCLQFVAIKLIQQTCLFQHTRISMRDDCGQCFVENKKCH